MVGVIGKLKYHTTITLNLNQLEKINMQCEMCFVDGVGESDLNLLCDECTKKLTIINNMIYFVKELENSEHEELTDGECLDKLMDDIKKLY
jgi:hypothetical protein